MHVFYRTTTFLLFQSVANGDIESILKYYDILHPKPVVNDFDQHLSKQNNVNNNNVDSSYDEHYDTINAFKQTPIQSSKKENK